MPTLFFKSSPVSTGMHTIIFYLQDGMPANFRNRQADWGGPSPVSAGMCTICFDLQDGMPANFRNRNVSELANWGKIMLADFRHQ